MTNMGDLVNKVRQIMVEDAKDLLDDVEASFEYVKDAALTDVLQAVVAAYYGYTDSDCGNSDNEDLVHDWASSAAGEIQKLKFN